MKYLIDTNICIYIINKKNITLIKKISNFDIGDIAISTITISELQFGISKSKFIEKNQKRLDEFLAPFQIIDYDEIAAKFYGKIRFQLEKQVLIIGPLDQLIAACALSNNLTLVTNNEKEFKRIKELKIENWIK